VRSADQARFLHGTAAFRRARLLALAVPAALLAGAWGSQLLGSLYPCEMCHWQRWPHYAAVGVALLSFVRPSRSLVALAALLVAASGAIGVLHAGVEYGWWEGFTGCTSTVALTGNADDRLAAVLGAPMIRCDVAQWKLAGISLAGFNALFSLGGAATISALLFRRVR
jgi:disulfide bond formation protein DsbB